MNILSDGLSSRTSGIGLIKKGDYNSIRVDGLGGTVGNLKVNDFWSSGIWIMKGDICANKLSLYGFAYVYGNAEVFNLFSTGKFIIKGQIKSSNIETVGTLSLRGGDLHTDCLKVYGGLLTKGNVYSKHIDVHGVVNAGNFLEGNVVKVVFAGISKIKAIKAERVFISREKGNNTLFHRKKIHVESIDAKQINVNNSVIEYIKGNEVTIGPNSRIGTIEYCSHLHVHPTSRVGKIIKLCN